MNEMDGVTQQNAVLVQEASTSAEALEMEAQHLAKTIAVFDLGGKSYSTKQPSSAPVSKGGTPVQKAEGSENDWETF